MLKLRTAGRFSWCVIRANRLPPVSRGNVDWNDGGCGRVRVCSRIRKSVPPLLTFPLRIKQRHERRLWLGQTCLYSDCFAIFVVVLQRDESRGSYIMHHSLWKGSRSREHFLRIFLSMHGGIGWFRQTPNRTWSSLIFCAAKFFLSPYRKSFAKIMFV